MQLSVREAVIEDFPVFFNTCFFGNEGNEELRTIVKAEWDVALSNPAFLTMLVEDSDKIPTERIAGCCQIVFVTDTFAQWAKSGITPRVNVQIVHPLPDGSEPLLDFDAVKAANSEAGLTGLIVRWTWVDRLLSAEEGRYLREFMSRNFHTFCRGYNFKEILVLCFDDEARDVSLSSGLRLRCDFADYYRAHEDAPPPHPVLMGLTRAEAFESEGSLASYTFVYTPPQFYFSEQERDVLRRASLGQSDEDIAEALCISGAGVKNWWRNIYERVEQRYPSFFEEDISKKEGARGREKRRILLRYLKDHPEELKPFLATDAKRP